MDNNNSHVAITFWGVRGSTPCANKENMEYGGNTTCVQVHLPDSDEVLILDSGTGIRNLGNQLYEHDKELHGRIFITHPHWDHIQGFPFFKPIFGHHNHFRIHMPRQEGGGCKEVLAGHLTKTFFPVTLEMIDANLEYITQPKARTEYKGYAVEFMLANHPIQTAIYKIHVGGKQIVFSPDNELNPNGENAHNDETFYERLMEFFKDVDVLIHDAQYNRKGYKTRLGWGHSAWEDVVEFADAAGVKHLFITHHDPDSDDVQLQVLDNHLQCKFEDRFESIQLAKEGARVTFK